MTVFERIENLRKINNISQGKLEKELGFSNGSISKWRTSTPTPERLQKLADYFGVSVDYLLGNAKRIFCHECGTFYNPLDEEDVKNHQLIHFKWENAVEKFGFCMNYIRADEKQLLHKKLLSEPNNSAGSEIYHFEELMKANFSDLIRANDFNYFYDYNTFVSKQLSKHSTRSLISEKAYEMLAEKYGIDYDVDFSSKVFNSINTGTPDDTPLNKALNKLNIGKNELTEEEIKDVVQFVKFIRSKKKTPVNSILNAAHAIDGASKEDIEHDNNIMDDDEFWEQ